MKVFIGQINPTVGALAANSRRILEVYREGVDAGAGIVLVTELALTGYPPRDLVDRPAFIRANLEARDAIAKESGPVPLVFGCIEPNPGGFGKRLRNMAVVAMDGTIIFRQQKTLLPTYDVFDELRYFEPAESVSILELNGRRIGLAICEDFWFEERVGEARLYRHNPIEPLVAQGAEVLLNISASPFDVGKKQTRLELFRQIARRFSIPLVYVNQVGANDELIFDGSSLAIGAGGEILAHAPQFAEYTRLVDLEASTAVEVVPLGREEELAGALTLGLRDYLAKCGIERVVLGLSGGIDSAVCAALAVEAIGPEKVTGLAMPSRFSSEGSVTDARALATNLGIELHLVPIEPLHARYREALEGLFGEQECGVTDENVQARIRGNLVMAWANQNGAMALTTGNKSELAVGYCTLYGDMAGGLALIGDVYKTGVYELARWMNRAREVIPDSSITKPPSAELRPDQTDQDSLPPYEVLDPILRLYIEEWLEVEEIVARGFERPTVERVVRMVDGSEFKRRQAPPVLRVSTKAFGPGRQMPIAQRWSGERGERR
jgi:NAD+ synthase (glutamine-hydrolysing)